MAQQPTVQIPVETIEKIAALGKAMLSLAESLKSMTEPPSSNVSIPIPDLTRPDMLPEGEEWFWSENWLAGEREANKDIQERRISGVFENAEELIADLNRSL